jgi:uncharacterized protein (DUF697 family)
MIVQIAKVYGQNISVAFASSLLGTVAATLVGKALFALVISAIPILKNLAGPPVAYGLTLTLGAAVIDLFATNKANSSQEEIKAVAEKYKHLLEKNSQACPSNAVLQANRSLN